MKLYSTKLKNAKTKNNLLLLYLNMSCDKFLHSKFKFRVNIEVFSNTQVKINLATLHDQKSENLVKIVKSGTITYPFL